MGLRYMPKGDCLSGREDRLPNKTNHGSNMSRGRG